MYKLFKLSGYVVIAFGLVFSAGAEEAFLIDFSQLEPDYPSNDPIHHSRTIVDYSIAAGTNYSEEDKAKMRMSLAIPGWLVRLNSSARSLDAQALTYARPATVRESSQLFPGQTVLGMRITFPTEPFNAWADVIPPFEILAYSDLDEVQADGTIVVPPEETGMGRKFEGFGIVKNVGTLRTVTASVYGLNYPHRLTLVIEDTAGVQSEISFGHMQFDGWDELAWSNPNYIEDVRMRNVRVMPLYPNLSPYVKLVAFRVYRDSMNSGGDFIGYLKDIKITFDKASLQLERSIDDELIWGIIRTRTDARKRAELSNFGKSQLLLELEKLRKHVVQDVEGVE